MSSERKRPNAPVWAKSLLFGLLLLLYLPLLVMVIQSFLEHSSDTWNITVKWYEQLFQDTSLSQALERSLQIAISSSLICTVLAVMGAIATEKTRSMANSTLNSLSMVSLIIPELVFALSLLSWFSFLHLSLGFSTVVAAHVTFTLPFVMLVIKARLKSLDHKIDEAAFDLGASRLTTVYKITLPLLKPALITGFLLSFLLSFDDFLITFFVSGAGQDTLPIKLYTRMKMGLTPELHALATLMLAASFVLILLLLKFSELNRMLDAKEDSI